MRKMLFCICLIIIAFTSCQNNAVIKIGLSVSLSGTNSSLGHDIKDSVVMAVEELNNDGGILGKEIELFIRDDENSRDKALQVDKELIDQGVVAIIGHITSEISRSVLELMGNENMVLISPTVSTKSVIELDDNLISLYPPNDFEQETLVDYIFSETNVRTISIIYDTSNLLYTEYWKDNFSNLFRSENGQVLDVVSFDSNLKEDLYNKSEILLKNTPDAVLIIASALDTAMISQQVKKIKPNTEKFTTSWAFDEFLISEGGSSVEDIAFAAFLNTVATTEKALEFNQNFFDRYKRHPSYFEIISYEIILILAEAIKKADTIIPMTIKEQIFDIEEFQGIQGTFYINQYGRTFRNANVYVIKNGEFQQIKSNQ